MDPKGYLCIILHAHLPFVRHPEHEFFLEEDWLYEAITETYVPLIDVFDGLIDDGVDFRLTMVITPTLSAMLEDPLLQSRYVRHISRLIELADKEIERTRYEPHFNRLAWMYRQRFERARYVFETRYRRNLLLAFKKFMDIGKLEIMACAATHAFLPLHQLHPPTIRTQINLGVESYARTFGRQPTGCWLPECGYFPGVDEYLRDAGIRYFIVESHGLLFGSPRPRFGTYAPVFCEGTGVAAFARDVESSKQVWSAKEGYPGDFDYREFYRDIGYDLDFDYIRPYIQPTGQRKNTGIKYYRITGATDRKEPYFPEVAREKAAIHAGNFMFNRERQIEHLFATLGRKPVIVAPYDAELFGHWWFEGPEWLNFLIRKSVFDQKVFRLVTPSEYLRENPTNQLLKISMSSWGWKGYNEVWLEGSNDWIYRHLRKAALRMTELALSFPQADGILKRALNQAARELLLAQSSDWPFIMKTRSMVEYAVRRFKTHILRFTRFYEQIRSNAIDEKWLAFVEGQDNLFPWIDYRTFAQG